MVDYLPMALIRTSPILSAISGAIGGTTFAKGKRGTVARLRPYHSAKKTAKLLAQQALYANVVRAWQALTPEQRDAWRSLARNFPATNRIGLTSPPSGFQAFTSANLHSLRQTGILRQDPPRNDAVSLDIPFTITFELFGPYAILFEQIDTFPSLRLQIWGSRHLSKTDPRSPPDFRIILETTFAAPVFFPVEVFDAWVATFGEMQFQERFSIRVRYYAPGFQISPQSPILQTSAVLPD